METAHVKGRNMCDVRERVTWWTSSHLLWLEMLGCHARVELAENEDGKRIRGLIPKNLGCTELLRFMSGRKGWLDQSSIFKALPGSWCGPWFRKRRGRRQEDQLGCYHIVLARDNEDLNQSGGNEGEEERADVKGPERNCEGRKLRGGGWRQPVLDMLGF